jgi:polysaccharide biosynthesis/export protein
MKFNKLKNVGLIVGISAMLTLSAFAQEKKIFDGGKIMIITKATPKPAETPALNPTSNPTVAVDTEKSNEAKPTTPVDEQAKPTETPKVVSEEEPPSLQTYVAQKPQSDEEKEILPVIQNYLAEYRLGPQDIISIEVFGQCPNYCIEGKTVPPTGKISYPLIRNGVFVAGKTVEEVQDDVRKKLDEYIIDPQVTVTLEKAQSARYSVLGKVVSPGVRIMERKISVYEAIVDSGGVLKEGDKKRVIVYSYNNRGMLEQKMVDLTEIEKGKAAPVYLQPGDQVFVPDAKFKLSLKSVFNVIQNLAPLRLLMGSPF